MVAVSISPQQICPLTVCPPPHPPPQVDQENYSVLADEPDPHVLAGSLKLFFRELPQPLLPAGDLAEAALRAAESSLSGRQRTEALRALVASLEPAHRSTLHLLLTHLNK